MKNINFNPGKIVYNEFCVDFSRPFKEQLDNLLEDLLQVEFFNGYLLDLGWYPEYDEEGEFVIRVIKDQDWESPVYKKKCKDEDQLFHNLEMAIKIVRSYNNK